MMVEISENKRAFFIGLLALAKQHGACISGRGVNLRVWFDGDDLGVAYETTTPIQHYDYSGFAVVEVTNRDAGYFSQDRAVQA